MVRPTPARILYLLIGLLLGAAILYGVARVVPAVGSRFATAPPPPAPTPAQFSGRTLERILAVNTPVARSGVTVRLNTIEVYADGMSLTYSILSDRVGATARSLDAETFGVTDDRGTLFTLNPFVSGSVPAPGYTAGYVAFSPAPTREATTMRIVIPHLLVIGPPREGQPRVIDGPWEFQVPLDGR